MSAGLFAIVDKPIDATALAALVAGPTSGAICTFEGTVRNHTGDQVTTHLEYEAFTGMAEAIFAQIAAAASERSGIQAWLSTIGLAVWRSAKCLW